MSDVTRTCTIYWPTCTVDIFTTWFTAEWKASYFFPHEGVPYSRATGIEVAEKLTRLQEEVKTRVSMKAGVNDTKTYGVPSVCSVSSKGVQVGGTPQGVQFWVAGTSFEWRHANFVRDIVRDLYTREGFELLSDK